MILLSLFLPNKEQGFIRIIENPQNVQINLGLAKKALMLFLKKT